MIQILSPNEIISKVLGHQTYTRDDNYRLSFSCEKIKIDEGLLLFNNLTKELLLIPSDSSCEEYLPQMVERWFYVPTTFDDAKLCDNVRSLLSALPEKPVRASFTILPTTACNANCYYCFEKNLKPSSMNRETALHVCDFIRRTTFPGQLIDIRWFGGEPLLSRNIIDSICSDLNSKGDISFRSSIVTNGLLLSEATIKRAIIEWNLFSVQITLDGTEDNYNRTKDFSSPVKDAYRTVLSNIKSVCSAGLTLNIRLNVDTHNIDDMFLLVDELSNLLNDKANVTISIAPLFEQAGAFPLSRTVEARRNLYDSCKRLLAHVFHHGFNSAAHIQSRFSKYCCTADNESSVVILPNGDLIRCENIVGIPVAGSIYDTQSSLSSGVWTEYVPKTSLCTNCPLWFSCRRVVGCKEMAVCTEESKSWEIEKLRYSVLMEYLRFSQKTAPKGKL